MNKKNIFAVFVILISIIFTGCADTLKDYEVNENSKYINEEVYKSGKQIKDEVELKSITFHSWTGSQKIIFSFSKLEDIPKYEMQYNEKDKKLIIKMKNVSGNYTNIEDYSKNKYVKEIELNNSKDSFVIEVYLKNEVRYRIDEDKENNNIIINLK